MIKAPHKSPILRDESRQSGTQERTRRERKGSKRHRRKSSRKEKNFVGEAKHQNVPTPRTTGQGHINRLSTRLKTEMEEFFHECAKSYEAETLEDEDSKEMRIGRPKDEVNLLGQNSIPADMIPLRTGASKNRTSIGTRDWLKIPLFMDQPLKPRTYETYVQHS